MSNVDHHVRSRPSEDEAGSLRSWPMPPDMSTRAMLDVRGLLSRVVSPMTIFDGYCRTRYR